MIFNLPLGRPHGVLARHLDLPRRLYLSHGALQCFFLVLDLSLGGLKRLLCAVLARLRGLDISFGNLQGGLGVRVKLVQMQAFRFMRRDLSAQAILLSGTIANSTIA